MSQIENTSATERALRDAGAQDSSDWNRVRGEFAAKAAAEGLVDICFERHDSPLGTLLVGATESGVVRIALPVENEDAVLAAAAGRISAKTMFAPRDSLTTARRQLDEYFEGARREFEVKLDWRLSAGFRLELLHAAAKIPYGTTVSYKELAAQSGHPAAIRAAGTAMATNPLPIIVPCHRVLRSGGALGNYLGGVEMKMRLLTLEGAL